MRHIASFCVGTLSCVLLSGCALGPVTTDDATIQGAAMRGVSYGGRAPISAQKVYLMEAVTTGYYDTSGTTHRASKSLLTSATGNVADSIGYYVLTDANGNWTINGDYTCDANAQVYLYAFGGDSGSGTNTGIGLMAALGQCPASAPYNLAAADPFVVMNEVTTVAAAYAMAGYATDATHVSSNGTALGKQGLANAFASAANLATISTGAANANVPNNSSGVAPQAEINTLGNILAACVNSMTGSPNCGIVFGSAQLNGTTGGQPTDTASAAINIAHNPGTVNVPNLWGRQPGTGAPYPSDLTSQPNDFTVGISFNGSIVSPQTVAIDGSGNVWVTGGSGLSVFTPTGAVYGNFHNSGVLLGLAMDGSGNAWTAGYNDTSITEITPSGGTGAGSADSLSFPQAIAIDAGGNVWVADCNSSACTSGGSVRKLTTGNGLTSSAGGLSGPGAIAFDISGNAWVANFVTGGGVSEFANNDTPLTSVAITASAISAASGVALDQGGSVWVTNNDTSTLSVLTSSGGAKGNYSGGGLSHPLSLAIDGGGNIWATNTSVSSLSEFSNSGAALSPSTGLGNAFFTTTSDSDNSVAVDGSGNVWTVDTTNGLLIELVGAATPVVTPIVSNLDSPYGSAAVNIP